MSDCKNRESWIRGIWNGSSAHLGSFHGGLISVFSLVICLFAWGTSLAQTNVTTQHNDIYRTGANTSESILTPQNVNSNNFGRLFVQAVDGLIVGQPLYMSNVAIPGKGTHNVVYVGTEGDSEYAFDADSDGGSNAYPLWHASFLTAAHGAAAGATTVPSSDTSEDITPQYGVTGTPVIDPTTNTLYVVSFTLESGAFVERLHALDITTGAEKFGGPTRLQGSVPGTGSGSSGGTLQFDPHWANQRPGLLLLNGTVFVGIASHGDNGPWHGWIFAFNASTMQLTSYFCASPNGTGSGIWMSGAGLAADYVNINNTTPNGRIFVATGNGDVNLSPPYKSGMDFGDSLLRLDLTGSGVLQVDDDFTPSNQAFLDGSDGDLGSGGILVLPTQSGAYAHLLVQAGKDGAIRLVNRDNLGGYNSTDQVVQLVSNGSSAKQWGSGVWGAPAYWNGNLYYPGRFAPLKVYSFSNGLLSTSPTSQSAYSYNYGPTPSVSANGNTNGIVWTQEYGGSNSATLRAYDATNLGNLLYSSDSNLTRDDPGSPDRFSVPTIANGKVYVRSRIYGGNNAQGKLVVFGLLNTVPTVTVPVITPGPETFANPVTVSISDSTSGASIYYTTDGSTPTPNSNLYTGPFTVSTSQTVTAFATETNYLPSATVSAAYNLDTQTQTPVFSLQAGTYTGTQSLTITDSSSNAVIYYTTDGSTPSKSSTQYTGPISLNTSPTGTVNETVSAIAVAPGLDPSAVTSNAYSILTNYTINFQSGFASPVDMQFNGNTALDDSRLQLTDGGLQEASSAFYSIAVNIQAFTTDFSFQLSNPLADGAAFVIQGVGPTALGQPGGGLGYQGIGKSMAIKFDLHSNAGEGPNSTGLYLNGAIPTVPSLDLTNTGINLHSDDTMDVHITYDGTNLDFTITDTVTGAVWQTGYQVNIPALVGGNTAYVGFTGGSGGQSSSQKIETWTFMSGAPTVNNFPPAVPNYVSGFSNAGLNYYGALLAGTSIELTDGGTFENRSVYASTKVNVQSFNTDFDFVMLNAVADGFTFIIQNQGAYAAGSRGSLLGSGGVQNSVAVKFDIHNNAGEGNDSTGVYLNGATPTVPAIDVTGSGVIFASGDVIHAHIQYDGTNLILTFSDYSQNATFTHTIPVNIPQVVGGNTAWVGFTAGTGSTSAVIRIRDWTYTTP